ncbi:MAG: hypothetical protein JST40_01235 [Armatimonadetes bacterium]|nr:hypothetical protein [Armatimonadota bacterium]
MIGTLAILVTAQARYTGVAAAATKLGYQQVPNKSSGLLDFAVGEKRPGLRLRLDRSSMQINPSRWVEVALDGKPVVTGERVSLADGLPIGDSYVAYASEHPFVFAGNSTAFVSAGIGIGGTREEQKGPFSPSLVEPEGYLVRWALGETVGMQCAATTSSKVNGVSIDCAKSSAYGITMGSLGDWVRARSWSANKNVGHGTCYLTKGTKAILLVMGSSQVKVNGKWVTAKQPTMFFNGDWYADLSVLESAVN